ncbi:MAG: hypothetical protein WCT08_04285 [Patescibacteria group bacterium]
MAAKHSLTELKILAQPALQEPSLIGLAQSNSPDKCHRLALASTHDPGLAKAARWLAVIKRDHGIKAFWKAIKP